MGCTRNSLQKSGNEILRSLAERFAFEIDKGTRNQRVLSNNYGFLVKNFKGMYISEVENLDEYGRSHMNVLRDCVAVHFLVIAFQEKSPYKKLFDEYILKFVEHGLIDFWFKQMKYKYHVESDKFYSIYPGEKETYRPINLNKLQGVSFGIFGGYLYAILLFAWELYLGRRCIKSTKK